MNGLLRAIYAMVSPLRRLLRWSPIAIFAAPVLLAFPYGHAVAQPKALARIGVLTLGVAPGSPLVESFRQGLGDLGYREGRDLVLDFRFAQGRSDALPGLAAELVSDRVDVIVTESNAAAVAARDAAPNIPVVVALAGDPVKAGVVDSLGRPGGNVTGLTLVAPELSAKRLQLLKQVAPRVDLVAVIWNPGNPAAADSLQETMVAARLIGVRLHPIEVRSPAELDQALDAVKSLHPSGLVTIADGMLATRRARIVHFALDNRMPGVFPQREFAEEGGLLSYGPDLAAVFRRSAVFVDRILKGAKPADLPTEQPTQFELVINTRTAKALDVTIPNAVLQRADQLIN